MSPINWSAMVLVPTVIMYLFTAKNHPTPHFNNSKTTNLISSIKLFNKW